MYKAASKQTFAPPKMEAFEEAGAPTGASDFRSSRTMRGRWAASAEPLLLTFGGRSGFRGPSLKRGAGPPRLPPSLPKL